MERSKEIDTESNNENQNQNLGHIQSTENSEQEIEEISGGISTVSDKSRRDDNNVSAHGTKGGMSDTED